uniref:Bactericidal permeability-increasing protein n=1 Tax=Terrapene triunguis TaxID=2587831 RepID=A0A674J3V9_9SAUR
SAQIDPFAAIDYSLVNKPVIAREHGDMDLKGEFYGVGKHRESPFSPAPFLLPDEGDHMLLLGLSEFSANSAAFVYFTAGTLRKNFRDDMVRRWGSQRCRTREGPLCFLGGSSGEPPPLPDLAKQLPAFVVLPNATLASAFLLDLVSAGHSPGPIRLASWIPLSEGPRRMGAGLGYVPARGPLPREVLSPGVYSPAPIWDLYPSRTPPPQGLRSQPWGSHPSWEPHSSPPSEKPNSEPSQPRCVS